MSGDRRGLLGGLALVLALPGPVLDLVVGPGRVLRIRSLAGSRVAFHEAKIASGGGD